ncbi:histidine kinase [Candidatus Dojkabacteria bacterium]|nr:histidine kinase [Candidatus Dojkabacteria bacterium]
MKQLANAFNNMTERLGDYIREVYSSKIKQNEAELNAIKSQIRPHYLYNTLEVIRMNAILEDANSTQELIYSLSVQLKYLIGDTNDSVSMATELDMIENYFKIIEVSFNHRISMEIDVADHLRNYKIQKLIIEPIVENSVVHGLKLKEGKGKVKVSAEKVDGTLVIKVIDDGVGLSQERVQHINDILKRSVADDKDQYSQSIGIKNVHDRIQLAYGKQYGVKISSRLNMGTLVEITVPLEEDESLKKA